MATFQLFISYAQIAVFHSDLIDPFNDWEDVHVNQGFAWRPGSVSFATLEGGGEVRVEVELANEASLRSSCIRAIQVPFDIAEGQEIEIASISDGAKIDIPAGSYNLLFQTGYDGPEEVWCAFAFIPETDAVPRVLRCDAELSPPETLRMEARTAS